MTKIEPSFIGMSHEEPLEQGMIIGAHGPFAAGKTTLAATASEKLPDSGFPKERHPPNEPPKYILDDLAWLSFDPKATAGFRERGVSVPTFDVPYFMGDADGPMGWRAAGFKRAPDIIQATVFGVQQLKTLSPKWLVVDTVSTFDDFINQYWFDHHEASTSSDKNIDTRKVYGDIAKSHTDFFSQCTRLGCGVIFLFHSKALVEPDDKDKKKEKAAKARQETLATATSGLIVPQITGKSKGKYLGAMSLLVYSDTKEVPVGTKRETEYFVWTKSRKAETKNRFGASLAETEPSNLRAILAKVNA